MPPPSPDAGPVPGDTRDLLTVLLDPCAEYIALGWRLERVALTWRERPKETQSPEPGPHGRAPVLAGRGGTSSIGRARERMYRALRGGVWEATIGFVRANGRRFATRVLVAPVRDARGRLTGFVVVSQHDEGTPLDVARQTRAAEAHAPPDPRHHPTSPALRFESVSCRTVVRQVAEALRPMARRMGLQFQTKLPPRDLVVRTDRRVLTDILLRLTNHAMGLTDHGTVRLEAGSRRDDHGRVFSEIRVVGGASPERGADRPQPVGQGDTLTAAPGKEARGAAVQRSHQLAMRLGCRINVDYARGRRSAFAVVLPHIPPRR